MKFSKLLEYALKYPTKLKEPKKWKSPSPDGYSVGFYQALKENTSTLLSLFCTRKGKNTPSSSHGARVSSVPHTGEDAAKTIMDQSPRYIDAEVPNNIIIN